MLDKVKTGTQFVFELLTAAGYEYGVDRVSRMSAAVAYRMVFALAPLFLIAVGVFGAIVGGREEAQARIFDALEQFFGDDVATAVSTFLGSAIDAGDAAAFVGVVLLLWTISSLFFEVQNDLNDIFHVPYEKTAGFVGFVKKRGIGFMWAVGLGVILLAVWLLNVTWHHLEGLFPENLVVVHRVIDIATPIVSVILLPAVFALLIQTLSMTTVRWKAVWFGAGFISIGFLVAMFGTRVYFTWEEGTSAVTVAGSFFVILLVAYVMSGVFLYGAVVTKVYHDYLEAGDVRAPTARHVEQDSHRPEVVVAEPPDPMPVAAVLGFLAGLLVGWRRTRS